MKRTADIEGPYRYHLGREWLPSLPPLLYVMLNPSTADALTDDATIRVCIGRAQRLNCGGVQVVNLFAYRATDPRQLRLATENVIGIRNDDAITSAARDVHGKGGKIICAWGGHETWGRCMSVTKMLAAYDLYHLGLTANGDPRHPLRIAYTQGPFLWTKGVP
jgi:hypothetical protein